MVTIMLKIGLNPELTFSCDLAKFRLLTTVDIAIETRC
jgi:hypothetical protein